MNRRPEIREGLYKGEACEVAPYPNTPSGEYGFGVFWQGRQVIGVFVSKEVANGVAATFDALTPTGSAPDDPPVDALLDLVGFRQILADVVGREAKRLAGEELATRSAAARILGRKWP